ncbi:hypothetical protein FMUBM48_24720 [Nocardia cyriacigeorgica]|nr:hypothetical protein FMUBM48_24720 [Nocardia cyriacigeorgica]
MRFGDHTHALYDAAGTGDFPHERVPSRTRLGILRLTVEESAYSVGFTGHAAVIVAHLEMECPPMRAESCC